MGYKIAGSLQEKILLIGFFLSGYAALTYEQIWIQLLSLLFGSSTYSYSILLGGFLSGLGIGSYVAGRFSWRVKNPLMALGWIELGVAFSSLLVLPLFERIDIIYLRLIQLEHPLMWVHPYHIAGVWMFLTAFLLIPTALLGAKFPVAARIYSFSKRTRGRDMGFLYSANTLGAVFGGWWTGFVFLPTIGIGKTYVLATVLNFLFASALFFYVFSSSSIKEREAKPSIFNVSTVYIVSLIFLIIVVPLSFREVDTRHAGVYYIAPDLEIEEWISLKKDTDILFNRLSPYGLVTVGTDAGIKYLSVNGKPEASNGPLDLDGQYILGYLPMFAHDKPDKVLHIGAGAGFTLDAISNFDVQRIDAVEINPLVLEAGRRFFYNETNQVFSDPRINFIVEDGRLFLVGSNEKYDVIVTTPSNPWVAGSSYLFTVEFYELIKKHLADGGVFTAWAPIYEYDSDDIKVYLNSLRSVFPEVTVFMAGGDMIMLASEEPIKIDYPRLKRKMKEEGVSEHFEVVGSYYNRPLTNEEKLLTTYRLSTEDLDEFVGETELSTDDKPVLEFRSAKRAIMKIQDVQVFTDVTHTVHTIKSVFAPPLVDVFSRDGRETKFEHMMLMVNEGDRWILDENVYNFIYVPEPNTFYIDRYFRYSLPENGVLYVMREDVLLIPDGGEFEEYVRDVLFPETLGYMGQVDTDTYEARAYEMTLASGSLRGIAHVWYCGENGNFYLAAVVYPVDADVNMEEPLSRIACS